MSLFILLRKEPINQRIEILSGLLRGTIQLPSHSELGYEESLRGYRETFEHIGRWVREYRTYHEMIKLQFLKYVRAQLEYKALAEALSSSKNSGEAIFVQVPVEVEVDGVVKYNDQFFLGRSEIQQQMIKLETSYPGIKKLTLSEFWQKSRFDASAVEFTGSIGHLRYRHAEVQEKIHILLKRLLSLNLRLDLNFESFSETLRDCKVSEFYISQIKVLFDWVKQNANNPQIFAQKKDGRPARFVLDKNLDADLPSEIAFSREVFNAQLAFVLGAQTEFRDDIKLLNRLLPIEKKEKIDLKGGWVRQQITKIRKLLVYSAVIGTLTSAAYSLYGVEVTKYVQDLQISAHVITSNIEKRITEVDTPEQLFKNLAQYIENRYPGENAGLVQKWIAATQRAITHDKNPDLSISELGEIENEQLASELQHLLALHYQYRQKVERNDLMAKMSQHMLVPQEKPITIESDIFNLGEIKNQQEFSMKAIDMIKTKLVKNLSSIQERELQDYLGKKTKSLSENLLNSLNYENSIQDIVKVYQEKYHRSVNERTIFVNYLSHLLSVRQQVQSLLDHGSTPAIKLQIIDLKYQKLKETFEFFDGTNHAQRSASGFPN